MGLLNEWCNGNSSNLQFSLYWALRRIERSFIRSLRAFQHLPSRVAWIIFERNFEPFRTNSSHIIQRTMEVVSSSLKYGWRARLVWYLWKVLEVGWLPKAWSAAHKAHKIKISWPHGPHGCPSLNICGSKETCLEQVPDVASRHFETLSSYGWKPMVRSKTWDHGLMLLDYMSSIEVYCYLVLLFVSMAFCTASYLSTLMPGTSSCHPCLQIPLEIEPKRWSPAFCSYRPQGIAKNF